MLKKSVDPVMPRSGSRAERYIQLRSTVEVEKKGSDMQKMLALVGAVAVVWTGFVALLEGSKDANSPDSPCSPF